jgi:hypothetical protein
MKNLLINILNILKEMDKSYSNLLNILIKSNKTKMEKK